MKKHVSIQSEFIKSMAFKYEAFKTLLENR